MKQRFGKFLGIFVVFAAIGGLAGCASVWDVLSDSTSPRLAAVEQQTKVLASQVMGLSAQAATKADRAEVAEVRQEVAKVATAQADTAKAVGDKLAGLEKRVVGVRAMATGAIGRIGALEDTQGVDHDKKLLRLSGFPTAKLDEKGELKVCAEISEGMKKKLAEVAALKKSGWEVKLVAGFADERPFRGKDGKVLAKSDELNAKCAAARAEAVAKALGVKDFEGRGTTTKFGGLDMNRSVLIYLERIPRAVAASAPAPPAIKPPATPVPAPPAPQK